MRNAIMRQLPVFTATAFSVRFTAIGMSDWTARAEHVGKLARGFCLTFSRHNASHSFVHDAKHHQQSMLPATIVLATRSNPISSTMVNRFEKRTKTIVCYCCLLFLECRCIRIKLYSLGLRPFLLI